MLKLGYKQSQGDHTLFLKHSSSGGVTALLVYVDDIIVTGDDLEGIENLKKCLVKEFEVKELEMGKLGCKPAETPIEVNHRLGDALEDATVDKRSMVDRRSTSGYCTLLEGNLVTWRSKKQNVVARSSAEAEFRAMALGVFQHDRTKHVEVDRHFIKEKLDSGLIFTPFVSTDCQLADILTKGLSGKSFQKLVTKLRMDDIHFPA
ncbi:uncharacterized protein LOC128296616 [Gossypium arboreum]|uniref:uncharacterized protein LOC128296616 n=1 Tax=Gossypium arboreum TaxID=29729 RepID=UPI0022F1B8B8|nr:uncharacterized protein LOC128296616 [Gossypium arboreum]